MKNISMKMKQQRSVTHLGFKIPVLELLQTLLPDNQNTYFALSKALELSGSLARHYAFLQDYSGVK